MKLDFPSFGGGSGEGGGPASVPAAPRRRFAIPRRLIERYLRQRLEHRPLDDAQGVVRVGLIAAGLFFGLFLVFALLAPMSGPPSRKAK